MNLEEFDINKIKIPSVVSFIVGGRGSGKTSLTKDLMYNSDAWNGIVFNGTESYAPEYGNFLNSPEYVHDRLSEEILDRCMKLQKAKNFVSKLFIAFDNIDSQILLGNGQSSRIMYYNRHYRISLFITTQTVLGISPAIRANTDYLFIMKNTSPQYINTIQQRFLTDMTTGCITRLMQSLNDHECLVFDAREDEVYKYKAKVHYSLDVKKVDKSTISIQKHWRRILAQRRLKRLRICNEIEVFPNVGIKYKQAMKRFNTEKFIY